MAFYVYHGHRRWNFNRGHHHDNHQIIYDQFYNGELDSEEWRDEFFFDETHNLDISSDDLLPQKPSPCNPDDLLPWDGPSDFSFSPDDFGTLVVSQTGRTDHGKIFLRQSSEVSEVTISLSILVADDKLASGIRVIVHKDETKGIYVLDVRSPFGPVGSECIKLVIDVTFPSDLESFKTFIRGGNVDIVAHSVSNIDFENIALTTFNGTIDFKSIWANKARFRTVHGHIKGSVYSEKLRVAAFVGAIDIEITPDITPVEIFARIAHGSAHIKVPGEFYSGLFKVYGSEVNVEAEDTDSLVLEKSGKNHVVGYYKEKEGGKIIVLGGVHAIANLTFL